MIFLIIFFNKEEEEPAFVFETFFAVQGEDTEASITREDDQLGNYRFLLDLILSSDWWHFYPRPDRILNTESFLKVIMLLHR